MGQGMEEGYVTSIPQNYQLQPMPWRFLQANRDVVIQRQTKLRFCAMALVDMGFGHRASWASYSSVAETVSPTDREGQAQPDLLTFWRGKPFDL